MEYKVKVTLPGYVIWGLLFVCLGVWCLVDLIYVGFDGKYFVMMIVSFVFGVGGIVEGTEIKKVNDTSDDE